MDDNQKEALRRSRVFLVQNLIPDSLWDHLVAYEIFTDMMLEYIKCKKPRSEQVRALLSDLNRRHRGAYNAFLRCLVDTGHEHCAQEIKNNMTKVLVEKGQSPITQEMSDPTVNTAPGLGKFVETSSSSSVAQEDVEMGIPEVDRSSSSLSFQESGSSSSSFMYQSMDYWYHKNTDPEDIYRMESNTRGFVYIINNKRFMHMKNRDGSDIDQAGITELFAAFGFNIYWDKDLTASEMRTKLEAFAQFEPLAQVDSCVIVILSHGAQHRMYGVDATGKDDDSCYITDNDLKFWFGNQNSQVLQGKPKLFLIQACRGEKEDVGAPRSMSSSSSSVSLSPIDKDICVEQSSACVESPTFADGQSLPNATDMVIAHSSDEGFVSYRSPNEGSIFISEVVNVFRECAQNTHVMDLLTKVNKNVATNFMTPDAKKMMPSPTSLLLKKWYLNPVINVVPSMSN